MFRTTRFARLGEVLGILLFCCPKCGRADVLHDFALAMLSFFLAMVILLFTSWHSARCSHMGTFADGTFLRFLEVFGDLGSVGVCSGGVAHNDRLRIARNRVALVRCGLLKSVFCYLNKNDGACQE